MKRSILIFAPTIGLLLPHHAPGQGTLYVSNIGQTSTSSVDVGSDSWAAAFFFAGTNSGGYTLNSIQLLMSPQTGNPSGLAVSIYEYDRRFPGNILGVLTGSDPVGSGIFTYSTPGIALSSSTYYFMVLTSVTPSSQGSFVWNTANTAGFDSSNGWAVGFFGSGLGYLRSPDGISWAGSGSLTFSPQFSVNATAVPEPGSSALVGLGLVGLSFWRCKRT